MTVHSAGICNASQRASSILNGSHTFKVASQDKSLVLEHTKISKFTEDLTIPPTNFAIYRTLSQPTGFPISSASNEPACNAGNPCSIPGLGSE